MAFEVATIRGENRGGRESMPMRPDIYCALRRVILTAAVLTLVPVALTFANEVSSALAPARPSKTEGDVLPTFQPGLWEFKRTLANSAGKPQVSSIKKCTNPTADIEQKFSLLSKQHCRFTPLRREHDRYASSWVCPMPQGAASFRSVLTVKGATGYEEATESRLGDRVNQQKIEAQRIGDCALAQEQSASH
jgi:hypothetical protein